MLLPLIEMFAVLDMHQTESGSRLPKKEPLRRFSSTPTQQAPSKHERLFDLPLTLFSPLPFSIDGPRSYHRSYETGYHDSV